MFSSTFESGEVIRGVVMINFEVIEEKWISQGEAKKVLSKMKKKDATPEQNLAVEYLRKTKALSMEDSIKLKEELEKINMRKLKEDLLMQVVDLLPKNAEELKIIVSGSKISFSKKDLDSIMKIVSKYVK